MDWPRTTADPVGLLFVTTAELFRQRTGKEPGYASAVWWDASKPVYLPIFIPRGMTVKKLYAANGSAVSGNCDIGLYTSEFVSWGEPGYRHPEPNGKLVSSGSTVQAGTSQWQAFDVTDCRVGEGWYWLAYELNNGTGQVLTLDSTTGLFRDRRVEGADVFPLPATATGINFGDVSLPLLAVGGIA